MIKNNVKIDYGCESITIDGRTVEFTYINEDKKGETKLLMNQELKQLSKIIKKLNRGEEIGCYNGFKHNIELSSTPKIKIKYYPTPFKLREKGNILINELLKNKIIRTSASKCCSPAFFIPKKNNTLRLVVDYSIINNSTNKEAYPCSNMKECLINLCGSRFFSTLDLNLGFYQFQMDDESIKYTAFSILNNHYEFLRMPFGLSNAPRSFQRAMNNVLGHLSFVRLYLDRVLVFSKTLEEHLEHIEVACTTLLDAGFTLNIGKCNFMKKEIEYL
ncbi:Retrovirus-related Pol polyprotein from transposon [Dictyocoela muelleri]|nr:Retrovirus-related Pol polyprotein from transposon [Dictyocoela muelleri]